MKKYILLALAFVSSIVANAQSETSYRMIVHHIDGTSTAIPVADIDYVDFEETPYVAPKVGDYYYADGTWSDGGLVSIDADGTNPVWAETKPAPTEGKTVIGIVCQTNADRMAETDKADGYTHGYVLACKNAAEPGRDGGTTRWVIDYSYAATKVRKLGSSWYENLDGRANTTAALTAEADDPASYVPAFYYSTTGFGVEAPASSSGWFLPSTGQLWDALANFLGDEAATLMKTWQTMSYDATYYCTGSVEGDNPLERFNAIYSLVPADQKDELQVIDSYHQYTSLWTSDRFDTESACQFNFGMQSDKNLVECMNDWFDGDAYARPMLAF